MEKLKVLITGSSGFLGSQLKSILINDQKLEIITYRDDLLDKELLRVFINNNPNIDIVVHLVGLFSSDIDKSIRVNFQTTKNLLEAIRYINIKKFVYSSSGAVYGDPISEKSVESDPLLPKTGYGFSKMIAEECVKYYSRVNGFDYFIARFPNIFGESQKKGVVYNLLYSIKNHGYVTIHGDGEQRRDFLHVIDASKILHKIIKSSIKGTFNISSNLNLSINELITIFKKETNFDIKYVKSRDSVKDISLNIIKLINQINIVNKESSVENIYLLAKNFNLSSSNDYKS